ncbi:uncharacterized protein PpBr36_05840 [Pyricularia pennisetigena]|uniref:uncharacterized protein n=1 Tax=Pyricularia pennisetigena TaxID=1578925 RepID=UPI0011549A70|nr:uncharacterized protein PpBr36_05840 [Pyricularia pennisetigena]TLS23016.1 hypothetical protein PpBr36_05840 [Pyricularia pennisetigena]
MDMKIELSHQSTADLGVPETMVSMSRQSRTSMPEFRGSLEFNQWTATRCHRLLRPLISSISALQRELARPSSEATGCRAHDLAGAESTFFRGAEPRMGLGRAKPKFTYSSKASKQHPAQSRKIKKAPAPCLSSKAATSEAFACSETAMPTPIAVKIRSHQLSSPVALPSGLEPAVKRGRPRSTQVYSKGRVYTSTRPGTTAELAKLRPRMSEAAFNILDSINRSFEAILRATAEPADYAVSKKSLFSMCLRKLPAYISGRQQWEREDAEARGEKAAFNPSEVSFGIYSELESLGACEGYKHLRTVARAHAVQIMVDAIRDGLLDVDFVGIIVSICMYCKANAEADLIMASVTDVKYPKPSAQITNFGEDRAMEPMRLMVEYGDAAKRERVALEAISRLLQNERLPHDWVLSDCWRPVWSMAVRVLCRKTACQRTIAFATTTISIICQNIIRKPLATGDSSTKKMAVELAYSSQKALVAAISPLATIMVIGKEAVSLEFNSTTQNRISAVRERIRVIFYCCIASLRTKRGIRQRSCIFLLLLALYLCGYGDSDEEEQPDDEGVEFQLRKLWQEPRTSQETAKHYDMAVALVGSIAQCCGRGSTTPASKYLNQLCRRVQGLGFDGGIFQSLEADVAFSLAARTNDLRDLAFAEALDSSRASEAIDEAHRWTETTKRIDSALPTNMFTGYRWEEGISEWVIASPPTASQKPSSPSSRRQVRISGIATREPDSEQRNRQARPHSIERVVGKQKVSLPVTSVAQVIPAGACLADGQPRKAMLGTNEAETPKHDCMTRTLRSKSAAGRKIGTNHEQRCGLGAKTPAQEPRVSPSRSSSRGINNPQPNIFNDYENPAKRRRTTIGLPLREIADRVNMRQQSRREPSDSSSVSANRKRRRLTSVPIEPSSDDELCL